MNNFTWKRSGGFSLIELMVTLAILGIIAAVALPSYRESTLRAGRADGKNALMQVAANQERFYSSNNSYSTNADPFTPQATVTSPDDKYVISVAACAGGGITSCFVATATPQGAQAGDICTTLTITNTGLRGATGATADECWQR